MANPIDVDVLVLGAGPAGIAAAAEPARAGQAVAIVTDAPPGGRAYGHTQLPSRLLSRVSRSVDPTKRTWSTFQQELRRVCRHAQQRMALRLDDLGIEVFEGSGRFVSPREVLVGGERLRFGAAVIATGGKPRTLGSDAANEAERQAALTPDAFFRRPDLPASLLVVGGGSAAAEIADALAALGSEVTWIMDEVGVLPGFDRELAEAVGDALMNRGVKLVHGKAVERVEQAGEEEVVAHLSGGSTYRAKSAVVAVGTRARLAQLDLARAELEAGPLGIAVDAHCRTSVPGLFAAGDCTDLGGSVALARAMGQAAGRGAAGLEAPPFTAAHVAQVAYTKPEVAQVGVSPEAAVGREVAMHTVFFDECEHGLIASPDYDDARGVLRVVHDLDEDRVIGASAVGPHAGELMNVASLAIATRCKQTTLATHFAAVPSFSDLFFLALR